MFWLHHREMLLWLCPSLDPIPATFPHISPALPSWEFTMLPGWFFSSIGFMLTLVFPNTLLRRLPDPSSPPWLQPHRRSAGTPCLSRWLWSYSTLWLRSSSSAHNLPPTGSGD